jgi:hypothetical protein
MKTKFIKYITIFLMTVSLGACDGFLDVTPPSTITDEVITDDALSAYYSGAFKNLTHFWYSYAYPGYRSFLLYLESAGEDVIYSGKNYGGIRYYYSYQSQNNISGGSAGNYWRKLYSTIVSCNLGLDAYDKLETKSYQAEVMKAQLLGLRAMCYFDLVRVWQHTYEVGKDMPVCVITKEVANAETATEGKALSTVSEVYQFIVEDIEQSISTFESLPTEYRRDNKGFINKNVAYGIAARVYLTRGTKKDGTGVKSDMDKASEYAHKAQEGLSLMSENDFLSGFNEEANSEWMLCLPQSTDDGGMSYIFNYLDTSGDDDRAYYKNVMPDPYFKKLFDYGSGYDINDVRYKLFKEPNTYDAVAGMRKRLKYPKFKFRASETTGDILFMRLAEMLLIEAEAIERGGNASGGATAAAIVSKLRTARGAVTTGYTVNVDFILKERRRELWGEGIAGIFDINRTQRKVDRKIIDYTVLSEYKDIMAVNPEGYPMNSAGQYYNTDNGKYYDAVGNEIQDPGNFEQEKYDMVQGHYSFKYPNGTSLKAESPYNFLQIPEAEILNNPKIEGPLPRKE